jgi:hypothetical protein
MENLGSISRNWQFITLIVNVASVFNNRDFQWKYQREQKTSTALVHIERVDASSSVNWSGEANGATTASIER